jgi:hypothetical protein
MRLLMVVLGDLLRDSASDGYWASGAKSTGLLVSFSRPQAHCLFKLRSLIVIWRRSKQTWLAS